MDDEYIRERAADFRDVTRRVLLHLLGLEEQSIQDMDEDSIIVTEDVTPSETAQMNLKFVKGFVTNLGGKTSHSAIMARTLDRKSTRLNSSHVAISYAVFCLK